MSTKDSTQKTFIVATLLCIICSSIVSSVAVSLKDEQTRNKQLDIKRNILECAGLIKKPNVAFLEIKTAIAEQYGGEKKELETVFQKVEPKIRAAIAGLYYGIDDNQVLNTAFQKLEPKIKAAIVAPSDEDEEKEGVEAAFQEIKTVVLTLSRSIGGNEKERVEAAFQKIEPRIIDLDTGKEAKNIDIVGYDERKAAKDPKTSVPTPEQWVNPKTRAKYAKIYLVRTGDKVTQIILPVHGKGLWSTLYGFLALSTDTTTVNGFAYYEHAETPGLGGEVDNPRWKAQWKGKKVYDENWQPAITVVKESDRKPGNENHEIDALSGATITSNGVRDSMRYWLSEHGFGRFLRRVREEGVQ